MQEIWKIYPLDSGYAVSNMGNVKALEKIDSKGVLRKERQLRLYTTKDGYKKCCIPKAGKKQGAQTVHRVVCVTFVGEIPLGFEINHLNGIRDDNRPENLEAVTHSDNIKHSKDVLNTNYATYGNGRMTPSQREDAIASHKNGETLTSIAKRLGFSRPQIGNVVRGDCWHI